MFYVKSVAIKVLEKARFAEQKQSKINFTSIKWKQTWKDVRTSDHCQSIACKKNPKYVLDTKKWKESYAQLSPRR